MVNRNVLSCLLKDGKEVNAVIIAVALLLFRLNTLRMHLRAQSHTARRRASKTPHHAARRRAATRVMMRHDAAF